MITLSIYPYDYRAKHSSLLAYSDTLENVLCQVLLYWPELGARTVSNYY